MTVKLVIQYQKNISVMQIPSISIWPYGVLPYLWKKYGNGQLKEENPKIISFWLEMERSFNLKTNFL
jgi:hypothetical protein